MAVTSQCATAHRRPKERSRGIDAPTYSSWLSCAHLDLGSSLALHPSAIPQASSAPPGHLSILADPLRILPPIPIMVAAGSITVAVRVRPPTTWEAARLPETVTDNLIRCDAAFSTPVSKSVTLQSSLRHIVQIVDDRVLTFDPEEQNASRAFVERGFMPPGTKRYKDRRFIFDRVYRHDSGQEEVYEGTAKPLLKNVLDGYNATIFAYGVSLAVVANVLLLTSLRPRDVARHTP